jgi:hypothetical protein
VVAVRGWELPREAAARVALEFMYLRARPLWPRARRALEDRARERM